MISVMEAPVPESGENPMDIPVIELAHPMPGFPHDARFALVRLDDDGMLHGFRSLDSDDLQFIVVPPTAFFPDYEAEIDETVAAELGIDQEHVDQVLVLAVVRAGATLADTTVNLRAPLVVNTATRRASQVILENPDLPVAAPLVA